MYKFLVFAGTTEGRQLVEYLKDKEVELHVCVATEYGEELLPNGENINISSTRLNEDEMVSLIEKNDFKLIIDATHPYAVDVTKNIANACNRTNKTYIRLLREENENNIHKDYSIYLRTVEDAVDYINSTTGNVLLTTGSKELSKFVNVKNYKDRLFARVLSTHNVIEECKRLGFEGRNLICMQGPFSEEFNYALLKQIDAKYMVTKESGKVGGFLEKINACVKANVTPIIIGRPLEEEGFTYNEVINLLNNKFNFKQNRKVSLVGIGMGSEDNLTIEGKKAIEEADVIIGARRMIEAFNHLNKPTFISYKPNEIVEYLDNNKEFNNIAILLSGDVGFYSGAKKLEEALYNYETKMICGICSLVYLACKIKTSWEDGKLISLHGRDENIIDLVHHNKKVFALLNGKDSVKDICKELVYYGLEDVEITIGENLSYKNEKITQGVAKDFLESEFSYLSVIFIKNNNFINKVVTYGINDDEFIRDKVPMTKSEIRTVCLSKLNLNEDSIVYDIGAGTGSVAIEIALKAPKGRVYAIEKNPNGIDLINKNKVKFKAYNLKVVEGIAPEAMENLEIPTHAFIGGSSGNLKDIVKLLLNKNPNINIVLSSIALETIGEALECIKELPVEDVDIVQIAASRAKGVGKYNMMMGLNPIYIISFKGNDE